MTPQYINTLMENVTKTTTALRPSPNTPQWFALKVSRKETLETSILEKAGLRTYCPMAATDTTIQGKKVIVERPLIPNTILAYAPFRHLISIKNPHPLISSFYP